PPILHRWCRVVGVLRPQHAAPRCSGSRGLSWSLGATRRIHRHKLRLWGDRDLDEVESVTAPAPPRIKIGSVVIHCSEFERTVAFWEQTLGYVPRNPPSGGWVVLRDPSGRGPNLSFQARERQKRSRSWLHLDLYTNQQQVEVERLVALG